MEGTEEATFKMEWQCIPVMPIKLRKRRGYDIQNVLYTNLSLYLCLYACVYIYAYRDIVVIVVITTVIVYGNNHITSYPYVFIYGERKRERQT